MRQQYTSAGQPRGQAWRADPCLPPLYSLCSPVAVLWASDSEQVPPADGGDVSTWVDTGSIGGTWTAVLTAEPVYRASTATFGGRPTFEFNGAAIIIQLIAAVPQPWSVVTYSSLGAVGAQRTVGTGNAVTQGVGRSAAGLELMNAGTTVTAGAVSTSPALRTTEFNGATSRHYRNDVLIGGPANANTGALASLAVGGGFDGAIALNGLVGNVGFAAFYSGRVTQCATYAALSTAVQDFYA